MLGNDDVVCLVVGEILFKKVFYDYKVKYEDGDIGFIILVEIIEE